MRTACGRTSKRVGRRPTNSPSRSIISSPAWTASSFARKCSTYGRSRCVPSRSAGRFRRTVRKSTSPMTTTSRRPSSRSAWGAGMSPPPKKRPFATMTSFTMRSRRGSESASRATRVFRYPGRVRRIATRKLMRPPRIFVVRFTRSTTAPPEPNSATLMKYRVRGAPAVMNAQRPTSIVRVLPVLSRCATSSTSRPTPSVRTKSAPVPVERTAIRPSGFQGRSVPSRNPLRTSFRVPSPPTETIVDAPAWTALRARPAACHGPCVRRTSNGVRRAARKNRSYRGQRRPVRPFADRGFTMKTVSANMVLPEPPVVVDQGPVRTDLLGHSVRGPPEARGDSRGDQRRDRPSLVHRLVEEPEAPHHHVREGLRHLGLDRGVDLGPHERQLGIDSLARPRLREESGERLRVVPTAEVLRGRIIEAERAEALPRLRGRSEARLPRRTRSRPTEADAHAVDDLLRHRAHRRELAPRDGEEPIGRLEDLVLAGDVGLPCRRAPEEGAQA